MFEKFEGSGPLDQDLFQDWSDNMIHEADTAGRLIKRMRDQIEKIGLAQILPQSMIKLSPSEITLLSGEPEV